MELFQVLEIFNVTVIALFVSKSRLNIDRGIISYITLTEDPWIDLGQVLWALHGSIPF